MKLAHLVRRGLHAALLIFSLMLAGCGPTTAPTLTPATPAAATPTATSAPQQPTPRAEPRLIRLWLPPRFDPANDTPASNLLRQRLAAFAEQNPGVRIEVRIKAEENFVRSLQTTRAAAPAAMPDLILLDRTDLERAAALGLLSTLDGLVDLSADPDWYPYARSAARIQNSVFGLPLAADMLVLITRPGIVGAFESWDAFSVRGGVLSFPAGDPQALFVLGMYQSASDAAELNNGYVFEQDILAQAFSFFETGRRAGVFSSALTQYQTDEQAYQSFREGRANAVLTWSSRFMNTPGTGFSLQPLTGIENEPFTLANAWVWALTTDDPEKRLAVLSLMQFLTDPAFMSDWCLAAGYLPPRPSALEKWTDANMIVTVREMSNSAHILPAVEFRQKTGPVLAEALASLLKGQTAEEVLVGLLDKLK
ncbi:MAG: extracellular solute-binding protein [Anaerolineales bacterium]